MSDSSPTNYDMGFNFIRFLKFIEKNNIAGVAIAAVLSDRINDITNEFVNNLILPILNMDLDGDGEKDVKSLEDFTIKFRGIKFTVGKFLIAVIRFIIVTYIVFIISSILSRVTKNYNLKLN